MIQALLAALAPTAARSRVASRANKRAQASCICQSQAFILEHIRERRNAAADKKILTWALTPGMEWRG